MNLEDKLNEVRQEYLNRMTRGNNALLRQVEAYITAHDGKMLRPRMTLSAAATLGESALNQRRTLLLATAIEMLHNVSLVHDDVIDRADERRSRPSVNARWGNSVAVLVGDYLLATIMQLLDEVDDPQAAKLINRTVMDMVEAELLAREVAEDPSRLTAETYLAIIDGKTARLFATAAALGNPAYSDFGLHYGRLFQLRDDVADGEATLFTASLIEQEEAILSRLEGLELQ